MVIKGEYKICESCGTPLTNGYEIHNDWDKCLGCKIEEDGYEP